jgi:hypothetical protein
VGARRPLTVAARTAAAVTAAALVAAPSVAVAGIPGPSSFATGLVDEATFQSPIPSVRTQWLTHAQQLGSSWIRLRANWYLIAPQRLPRSFAAANPADPSYNFSTLDASIKSAAMHGQRVIIQLVAPPSWALGPKIPRSAPPGTWRPSPRALGAFAHAVAARYSGRFPDPSRSGGRLPRVSYFQIWNEPNLRTYLSPQWTHTSHGFIPASPSIYRGLLNSAYAGIKSAQSGGYVIAAGTAPYGDRPGVDRMAPVLFWRELLCLHGAALRPERCQSPAHLDAIDHHPYSLTPTGHAFAANDVSVPDIGRLQRILRSAERTRRVLPRGGKPIWVTEIDWDSNPPDRSSPISIAKQARYLDLAFYQLWRQGVSHVLWFILQDISYKSLAGSGLYFASGAAKPSATAFHFPFVAVNAGHGMLTLWGRAPRAGNVTIQRASGHGWRLLAHLTTTRGGVFYARRRLGTRLVLRAAQGALTSRGFSPLR